MATCFVISPIGQEGTPIFDFYNDLFELVLEPAFETFDELKILRGDHCVDENNIDASVIKNIQDAEICICDISINNPNVFYELGRRDETGKPIILIKNRGEKPEGVGDQDKVIDIATRRYFEYDLSTGRTCREAQELIRSLISPYVKKGFEGRSSSATLGDIAESISRLERKIDRLGSVNTTRITPDIDTDGGDETSPATMLRFAIQTKNIPLAESAMLRIQPTMDKLRFLDRIAEVVAAMGSKMAGDMLIENAEEFMDSNMLLKDKIDYISCLVSNISRRDIEPQVRELVESICVRLASETAKDPKLPAKLRSEPFNQINRIYYGVYCATNDTVWLEKAIEALEKATEFYDEGAHLFYNLSTCYFQLSEKGENTKYCALARDTIDKCLELSGHDDIDHLKHACRVYKAANDPKLYSALEKLQSVNQMEAAVLRKQLGV